VEEKKLAVVTITLARDEQEEALLREALGHLARLNIPVFVTDGGSKKSFVEFLGSFPNFVLVDPPQKGVWMQAESSLLAAHEAGYPFVFYTEPDKADFFAHALPPLLDRMEAIEQTGVVMISRSEKAFASFPPFQQMTESTINHCCAEVTGKKADYVYGPFLLNSKVIPHLKTPGQDLGWGWRPYAFNLAWRLGYAIESITGDFFCPAGQQQDSPAERLYRMRQLTQNVAGLTLSASVPLGE
jgi:hypothetical protein